MARGLYGIYEHIDDGKFYKFPFTEADKVRAKRLYSTEDIKEHGDNLLVYEIAKRNKAPHHELPLFHETDECFLDHWTIAVEEFEDETEFVVVGPLVQKGNSPEK